MIDDWTLTLVEVTPAEIERASGLGVDLQRVWRRRNQLPDRKGPHARFDVFAVAAIMVRVALTKRGIPPGESVELGRMAAPSVVWCALMFADGLCEVRGERVRIAEFEHCYFDTAELIDRLAGISQYDARRYLVAFDDEEPFFENDLGPLIDGSGSESGYYVNLEVLGARLAERVGRPLMVVQIGQEPGSDAERRRQFRRLMRSQAARRAD